MSRPVVTVRCEGHHLNQGITGQVVAEHENAIEVDTGFNVQRIPRHRIVEVIYHTPRPGLAAASRRNGPPSGSGDTTTAVEARTLPGG